MPSTSAPIASGKLDPTYGTGGFVFSSDEFYEMTVVRDGSVIVSGKSLVKISPSGQPAQFGDPVSPELTVYGPVVDSAGNLYARVFVAAGGTTTLAKYDPQGRLAPDFGTGGLSLPGVFTGGQLLRDPAGQLHVVATFPSGGIETMWVQTYDSSGRPLTTYGQGGFAKVEFGGQRAFVNSAAVDAEGNVYAMGSLLMPGTSGIVVAKFDPNGRLADFATGGVWTRSCGDGLSPWAIAVDANQNVFVGASCFHLAAARSELMLFKLDPQGNVVASFREGGARTGLLSGSQIIRAILPGPGGAIYVAGESGDTECADLVVTKLDAQGNEIASFGTNGIATLNYEDDSLTNMGIDDAGRLYLGSTVYTCGRSLPGVNVKKRVGYAVYRIGG